MSGRSVVNLVVLLLLLAGCASPEQKVQKYYDRGADRYAQGDYVNARLEFKNALQIDPDHAPSWHLMGMSALKNGNVQQAFRELGHAALLDPENTATQLELGKIYLAGRRTAEALERAELVLAGDASNPDGLLLKAAALLMEGRSKEARVILEALPVRGVTRPDVYLLLSRAHGTGGDDAEAVLREGIERNPRHVTLHITLARLLVERGRPAEAVALMETVVALEPEQAGHRFNLASLYWDQGQRNKAETVLQQVVDAQPHDEDIILARAAFYHAKNESARERAVLERAVGENPQSLRLHRALSDLCVGEGRIAEARTLLEQALTLEQDPAHAEVIRTRNALALLLLETGKVGEAASRADEILAVSPGNVDAHLIKGRVHLLRQEHAAAVTEFRTVVHERPGIERAHLLLAEAHQAGGETGLALDTLRTAHTRFPESRAVTLALCRCCLTTGNLAEAEKQLAGLDENAPEVIVERVRLCLLQGRDAEARRLVRAALQARPDNAALYLALGNVYLRQKQASPAASLYAQVLKYHPHHWVAANNLAFLLCEHGGDLDKALELAELARREHPGDPMVLDTLGWIAHARGEDERAITILQEAVALAPENADLRAHLDQARRGMEKP